MENIRLQFEVHSSDADEHFNPELPPNEIVMELAKRKAENVAGKYPGSYVVGSDTIVVLDGQILGKPGKPEEAAAMLRKLSGRSHYVYTGVSIFSPKTNVEFFEKTEVVFWELTEEEITAYVKSGEPFDKAGAYGIQGLGSLLVKKINGDYFSVVGLPVSRTVRELKRLGYPVL